MTRILLVEDNRFDRMLFVHRLRALEPSWVVEEAVQLSEALEMLAASDFDLIVTDLMLPDGHGSAVTDALAAAGAKTIVVLSGMGVEGGGWCPEVVACYDKDDFTGVELRGLVNATP